MHIVRDKIQWEYNIITIQADSLSVIFPNALREAIGEHLAELTRYILVSLLGMLIKSIPLAMINMM